MTAFSDGAVGGGSVVDGKVEEDEVGIIRNGRRGFACLDVANDCRRLVSVEISECGCGFVAGGVGDGDKVGHFGGIGGEIERGDWRCVCKGVVIEEGGDLGCFNYGAAEEGDGGE
jgi:hypothetical protein